MEREKHKRKRKDYAVQRRMRAHTFAACLTLCGIFVGCQFSNQTEPKPNDVPLTSSVVWLVCEDQSLFMPMYGDSLAHMPNVQSLAEEGTTFDHFFSVAPVCAPSRSSILTGLQPSFLGTHHMRAYQKTENEVNKHTGLPWYSAPAPEGVKAFTEHLRMQGVYYSKTKEDIISSPSPCLGCYVQGCPLAKPAARIPIFFRFQFQCQSRIPNLETSGQSMRHLAPRRCCSTSAP